VHKFAPDGKPLAHWAITGADGTPLTDGAAMLLRQDHLEILDAATADLIELDLSGKLTGRTHLCECFRPRALAPAAGGNYWVADTGNNRLLKITPGGAQIKQLGEKGSAPGQFVEPAGVWEATNGTLYVADIGNARVQSFTADGQPLAAWPVGTSVARDGNRVVADSAGNVLVSVEARQALVLYDARGHELQQWLFRHPDAQLQPTSLAPAGGNSFLVLYLRAGLAALFTPGQ